MKRLRCISVLLAVLLLSSSMVHATGTEPSKNTGAFTTEATEVVPSEIDEWNLILVNPWNQIPADHQFTHQKLANGMTVDQRIYADLCAMLSDCWKAGLHPVVCSAYRPYSTQQRLYRNKISRLLNEGYSYSAAVQEAGRWVAPPGTSEHQTGLALDIVSYRYQILDQKQEETAEQKWLMAHCWEYGFVLRYPPDKSELTGIGYEPWHYRYVGRDTAAEMKETGMCLEEYVQYLKQSIPLLIADELRMYMKEKQVR